MIHLIYFHQGEVGEMGSLGEPGRSGGAVSSLKTSGIDQSHVCLIA